MAINLTKKQTISLTKTSTTPLRTLTMGLGWDAAKGLFGLGGSIDLDASCLVIDQQRKLLDVVYFRQLFSKEKAIKHSGDNRTGTGEGDDETIFVDLTRLNPQAYYLAFVVNSFTGQRFNRVKNAYCRICNDQGQELARYDLGQDAQGEHTGLILLTVTRHNQDWQCTAIGEPVNGHTWHDLEPSIRQLLN